MAGRGTDIQRGGNPDMRKLQELAEIEGAGGTSPASIGVTAMAAAARTRTGTTRSPSPGRTRTKAWTRR